VANRNRLPAPAQKITEAPDLDRESKPQSPDAAHPYERQFRGPYGFAGPGSYPYSDVASEERRGRFFGRGPKGYRRSDERIKEDISDRLMTHPDIDASDIEVAVTNGVVTLTGTTEDRHEKRLAEYIVEDVVGIDDVENRLKVRHGFWATIVGEKAAERQMPILSERDSGTASSEAGRNASARNAARRNSEAR
jgi:BON domain-containing protein